MSKRTADLLLELGVEEMPAHGLTEVCTALKQAVEKTLSNERLEYKRVAVHATPRRLTVHVESLAEKQSDVERIVRGPAASVAFDADGRPTRAAEGFARSQGISVDELVTETVDNGTYVFARRLEVGRPAETIIADHFTRWIESLQFTKTMRWGDLDFRFIRPIRWLLALFGDQLLPLDIAGVTAQMQTYGHRTLAPGPWPVRSIEEYYKTLEKAYIILDPEQRRAEIERQAQALAEAAGGRAELDDDLVEEVTFLVEYPTAFLGSFHEEHLSLPKQVLTTVMAVHQRYFPVVDEDGSLLPNFIGVRNGGSQNLAVVTAGNEKVLRARLADARFFFDEDTKRPLADYVERLTGMMYQKDLGTMLDKAKRLERFAMKLAEQLQLPEDEKNVLLRSALLCKADLVTHIVYEFPELQGVMGREYALRSGEKPAVAQAIGEHYMPTSSGGELPESLPGCLLALCDKIDALLGSFAIGIQPTGSHDPYGLRRQAVGVLRIVTKLASEGRILLTLTDLLDISADVYKDLFEAEKLREAKHDVLQFFQARLRVLMTEARLSSEVIEAVLARNIADPRAAWDSARVLEQLWREGRLEEVLTVYRRCANLAKQAEAGVIEPAIFETEAEKECYKQLEAVRPQALEALRQRDYIAYYAALSPLRRPVDQLLDSVMIMADNERIRRNRLAMLRDIAELVTLAADLGRLPG